MEQDLKEWSLTLFAICFLGSLANLLMMIILSCHRSKITKSPPHFQKNSANKAHYVLLINLFIADFLLCFFNGIAFLVNAQSLTLEENSLICRFQGVSGISFACLSVFLLCAISYDRYVSIVRAPTANATVSPLDSTFSTRRRRKTSLRSTYVIVVFAWTYSIVLGFVLLSSQLHIVRSPSEIFCTTEWQSRSISNILYTTVCLVTLILTIGASTFWYYKIYRKIKISQENVAEYVKNSKHSADIAYRMSILVILFLIGWGTYCTMIFYNLIMGQATNRSYDTAATLSSFLNSALNPIVYLLLNRRKYCCNNTNNIQRMTSKTIEVLVGSPKNVANNISAFSV